MVTSIFVKNFLKKIESDFNIQQLNKIEKALSDYSLSFNIQFLDLNFSNEDYQLPEEYYYFLAAKQQDGRMSDRSKRQYSMCLQDMLFYLKLPLKDITINHLRMYLQNISKNKKTGKTLCAETLNQRKSIIKSFFKWLYQEEYITKDPSTRIKREKSDSKPRKEYEDIDIEKIRRACKNSRDIAIVDLLISSGIRISECVNLNIKDIDFQKREFLVFGKGGKWRTSYLDAKAIVSLNKYLEERTDNNEALFVTLRAPHQRISASGIRRRLHQLSPECGVQNIIPHRFRHTMATSAINNGMPIESVQALLGHSEIETTMKYAHISNEKIKMDHERYIK